MLKKRIIPKLIVNKVYGTPGEYSAFVSYKYNVYSKIGSLDSQLKIFESNRVDELLIINADKTMNPISKSFLSYISSAISGLKTPVTVGGGIASIEDAENLVTSGTDKLLIGLNRANLRLINDVASKFGSQAVIGSYDYFVRGSKFALRGKEEELFGLESFVSMASDAQSAGIGEVLLNCIDNDGSKNGFELKVVSAFHTNLNLPIIVTSGAGKPEHFVDAFEAGVDGVSAGTYFSKLDQSPLQLRSRLLNQGIQLRK